MPGAAVVLALLRRRARRRARERIFRTRIDVFDMGELEVYRTYRFSREVILELTRILQDDITSPAHCKRPSLEKKSFSTFAPAGRKSGLIYGLGVGSGPA